MGSTGDRAASLMLREARKSYVGTYGFNRASQPSARQSDYNDNFEADRASSAQRLVFEPAAA